MNQVVFYPLVYSIEDEKIHASFLFRDNVVYVAEIIPENYPPVTGGVYEFQE
jgi:hypothetical protein